MFFVNLVQHPMHAVVDRFFDVGETSKDQAVVSEDSPAERFVSWATDVHPASVQISAIGEVNDGFFFHDVGLSFEVVGRP